MFEKDLAFHKNDLSVLDSENLNQFEGLEDSGGLSIQNLNFIFSKENLDLKFLTDAELESRVKLFFKSEKRLNKNLLDHLAEMDRRELYLKAGYQSFYEYLNIRFQVEGGSAQRRIDAARLIQKIPRVSEKLQDGSLSLNQIGKFQQAVREKRKSTKEKVPLKLQEDVIKRIENLSPKQTDSVLAQAFDFKLKEQTKQRIQKDESIRVEITFSKSEYEMLIKAKNQLSHQTFGDLKLTILKMAEKTIKDSQPKEKKKSAKLQNTEEASEIDDWNKPVESQNPFKTKKPKKNQKLAFMPESDKNLLSKTGHTDAQSPLEVQTPEITSARGSKKSANPIKVMEPYGKVPRVLSDSKSNVTANLELIIKPNKTLTPKTKRQVLTKQPCCQYKSHQTGKICGAKIFLEVDHVKPKFAGGTNEITNLRTLCRNHNQFRYKNGG